METPFLPIIFILVVITVIVLFALFNDEARIKRKLKKAPYKPISSFKDGEIGKIIGKISSTNKPMLAPLSKRKCVSYHIVIQQKKGSGKSSSWRTIINKRVVGDFLIQDNGSFAFVNDKKIKSVIVKDKKYSSGFLNDATPELESFLNTHGIKSEGFFGFNKTLRYKEGILEPNETIAVLGKVKWKSTDSLDLWVSQKEILEISSYEKEPVYLSDHRVTTNRS